MCTTQVLEQVSGSADHRKEYDKLKTAKDQAEAASLLAYQKKKGLAAQRRQVRDQKDEADAYEKLRDELQKYAAPQRHMSVVRLIVGDDNLSTEEAVQALQQEKDVKHC